MQEGNKNSLSDKLEVCDYFVNQSTLISLNNESLQHIVHLPHSISVLLSM